MLSLNLVDKDLVPEMSASIKHLKPRELFYLRLKSLRDLTADVQKIIVKSTMISSEVYLSVPVEDFLDEDLRNKYFSLGVKGFVIRQTHQVEKWLIHNNSGQLNAGDRDIIENFIKLRKCLSEDQDLVVEFQVGVDTRVLGPTITGLYEAGASWVVLNPEGEFTPHRAAQFRDVFEYLKIRSCPYLNVYFPFWKEESREWNIKTQNTFSGLEDVHIDISNRCTHSCVFCGLYGPDAMDEMKTRSGGTLTKEITDYLKMEINSEKCFKIIESLPWSVRYIQFGGYGDPLMHENAVNFISAARRRGFSVEMLSNMEYLTDEDIQQLHDLGGIKMSHLHFIANVSGGTPQTYIKTRPKQSEKDFHRIVSILSKFSELREKNNNSGVHFTIMCVVNRQNCLELLDVAKLAKQTGASRIWFKPMEVHADVHKLQLPLAESRKALAKSLKDAVKFSEENGIEVFQREYCEEIINQYSGDTVNV